MEKPHKFLNKLKNLFSFRKCWYALLLIASSIYVYKSRNSLVDFSEISADDIIFIVWVILLLFPLFSEIEVLGVKFKKELEKSVQAVKDSVADLRLLLISSTASAQANQSANIYVLGIDQSMEIAKKAGLIQSTEDPTLTSTESEKSFLDTSVPSIANFLFEVRYTIEKKVARLFQLLGNAQGNKSLPYMIQLLQKNGMLDEDTTLLLLQITSIANRGIHGESVDDEYIRFVTKIFPSMNIRLDTIYNTNKDIKLYSFICPRCHFNGLSLSSNTCPRCGYFKNGDS